VLVVDELDKVRGLPDRLEAMIHFLKKLVAENVFTCFLTDRGYLEHLRICGRGAAYDLAFFVLLAPLAGGAQTAGLRAISQRNLAGRDNSGPGNQGTSSTAKC